MFEGKARALSRDGLDAAGRTLGIDLPALWAVMTVETRGCGFLPDRRPAILFERHIFHRRTNGRFDAAAPDISNTRAGGYGPGGAAQYERLMRAVSLDRQAALESTSWGLGQIMGFNAGAAGFPDVESMVKAMSDAEDRQLGGMIAFVRQAGLGEPLKRGDWKAFARGYNGPDFQKNRYDVRLAQAHARYTAGPLPDLKVRAAQLYLNVLGYGAGSVDGWFGQNTQRALQRFQKARGLAASGVLDDASIAALEEAALG